MTQIKEIVRNQEERDLVLYALACVTDEYERDVRTFALCGNAEARTRAARKIRTTQGLYDRIRDATAKLPEGRTP